MNYQPIQGEFLDQGGNMIFKIKLLKPKNQNIVFLPPNVTYLMIGPNDKVQYKRVDGKYMAEVQLGTPNPSYKDSRYTKIVRFYEYDSIGRYWKLLKTISDWENK